jgi:hypothetical protein
MNTDLVELIILLVGGSFLPVTLPREKVDEFDATIEGVLGDPAKINQWLTFKDSQGSMPRRVHPKAIIGWYFREHKPPAQERMVTTLEKLEKKMPDGNEGDSWKGGRED